MSQLDDVEFNVDWFDGIVFGQLFGFRVQIIDLEIVTLCFRMFEIALTNPSSLSVDVRKSAFSFSESMITVGMIN